MMCLAPTGPTASCGSSRRRAVTAGAGQPVGLVVVRRAGPGLRPASRKPAVVAMALDPHTAAAAAVAASDVAALAAAHHASIVQPLYTVAEGGPIELLAGLFESILKLLDEGLEKANVPYPYGFAIILLTILVKLATFPLSQKQVESTISLQALQPRVKELQAKHADDPETLQLETARLYKEAGVNPLAGCLPTLATIPVFIGLYNALSNAAKEGLLQDAGFFWIPSLGGPTTIGGGLEWLFPFQDGHPPIGWGPAASYLVLPVLLVVSQYVSQKIISTQQQTDPSQQQAQAILKVLPVMLGWFSLNVPSGLTLYWFVNNILSTSQQLYLKATIKVNVPEAAAAGSASTSGSTASSTVVKPKEERVKKVSGKDLGSRKKRRADGGDESDDTVDVELVSSSSSGSSSNGQSAAPAASSSSSSSNGAGGSRGSGGQSGKGSKFRAIKAREAAAKAASVADSSPSQQQQGPGDSA